MPRSESMPVDRTSPATGCERRLRRFLASPKESWLRLWLIDSGFREPVVHPAVYSRLDDCVLHPDLGYPELRIAIEYEGDHHRISPAQYAQDIRRSELFEAEGWMLLRVAKQTDMASFAKRLEDYIAQRSPSHWICLLRVDPP